MRGGGSPDNGVLPQPQRNLSIAHKCKKMVEEWPEYDLLGAMQQLGAIPEPQQAGS
jgi:hypothetical protein